MLVERTDRYLLATCGLTPKPKESEFRDVAQRNQIEARIEFTWAVENNRVPHSREVALGFFMSAREKSLERGLTWAERTIRNPNEIMSCDPLCSLLDRDLLDSG